MKKTTKAILATGAIAIGSVLQRNSLTKLKMAISKQGKLTKKEALKSGRDILIVAVAAVIPQLLTLLETTDFGEWNLVASIVLAIIAPLANRWLNLIRIK